ncbi:MAG: hypothetical protein ACLP6E_07940 [Acidimicrobiales bacterium]
MSDDTWLASLNRHWYLDWEGPRPESLTLAAAEMILREQEAAVAMRAEADSGGPTLAQDDSSELEEEDPTVRLAPPPAQEQ